MAIREFVYRIDPPGKRTVDQVKDALVPAAQSMLANKWLAGVELELHEDHVLMFVTMTGHDRWWIKKRAPYIVVAILTQAELEASDARIVEVRSLPNLKKARYWTEGYRQGKRVTEPPDGTDPKPVRQRKCKSCKPPDFLIETRSGWQQPHRQSRM